MIAYIDKGALRNIANRFAYIIAKRTEDGLDKNGMPFKPYSTKPFKMPSGAATKKAKMNLLSKGELKYFKTKGGKLWIVVTSGYLGYKMANYTKTSFDGKPNLMMTGQMMAAFMPILFSDAGFSLGFSRPEEAQKMLWNIQKGRDILGMTDKDLQDPELLTMIASSIKFK